jgi:hypothetical protein
MKKTGLAICIALAAAKTSFAQFSPAFLQNNSYWGDNKAEFDFYDAQIMRDGQARGCEVIHIAAREPFDPKQWVKVDDWKKPGVVAVVRFNQIATIPMGLFVHQQMHSTYCQADNGMLLKWSLTFADSLGNTFKEMRRFGDQLAYNWHTALEGAADGSENVTPPANGYFYEELPLRVRTIEFAKPSGEFEILLASSVCHAKKDNITFKPAKVNFTVTERKIDISVQHDAGTDKFVLDGNFPFLLREWNAADGSRLKLKNSLKVDYWNYGKNGDRERALKNPMLGHPD